MEYSEKQGVEHCAIPAVEIGADSAEEDAARREPLEPGEERGPRLIHPEGVRDEQTKQDAEGICDKHEA